jgi:hypothetical protein
MVPGHPLCQIKIALYPSVPFQVALVHLQMPLWVNRWMKAHSCREILQRKLIRPRELFWTIAPNICRRRWRSTICISACSNNSLKWKFNKLLPAHRPSHAHKELGYKSIYSYMHIHQLWLSLLLLAHYLNTNVNMLVNYHSFYMTCKADA